MWNTKIPARTGRIRNYAPHGSFTLKGAAMLEKFLAGCMWGLVVLALIQPAPILPGPFLVGCLIMAIVATIVAVHTSRSTQHKVEHTQSWEQYMEDCRGHTRHHK